MPTRISGAAADLKQRVMRGTFKGMIDCDIRDLVTDSLPFEPPRAPDGAPDVLSIMLADVGFSAIAC